MRVDEFNTRKATHETYKHNKAPPEPQYDTTTKMKSSLIDDEVFVC